MVALITYGSVANTRHSAKHCNGAVVRSRRAIIAGKKPLNKGVTGAEYRAREAATLASIHRGESAHLYDYDFDDDGNIIKVLAREETMDMQGCRFLAPIPKRKHGKVEDYDTEKSIKPFKKLKDCSVNASAGGRHNGGTKDQSVSSTVRRSPDVDSVSSMTGVVSLARDGHHVTKVSDSVYAKERAKFRECMKEHHVQQGRDTWTDGEKKRRRLRKAALRNAAEA